ncbi:hypothetical protein AKJ16_DCAP08129 [Drosera capensis]
MIKKTSIISSELSYGRLNTMFDEHPSKSEEETCLQEIGTDGYRKDQDEVRRYSIGCPEVQGRDAGVEEDDDIWTGNNDRVLQHRCDGEYSNHLLSRHDI